MMYTTPPFEIPPAARELAEKNVQQVRDAYQNFINLMQQAQDTATKSQGSLAAGSFEIHSKALSFAQANIEANFRFAADLAKARDVKQYMEIQTSYVQAQLATYNRQAQEISKLVTDAAVKMQPKA